MRLQPNHPTDDPRGIAASILDGLMLGADPKNSRRRMTNIQFDLSTVDERPATRVLHNVAQDVAQRQFHETFACEKDS